MGPSAAASLRRRLLNPSTRVFHVQGSPKTQVLVDSILLLRDRSTTTASGAPRRFSAALGQAMVSSPAIVAMVAHLQDPRATALILRRPGASPHDVVLSQTNATSAELGAALKTLGKLRANEGDVPVRTEMVSVHRKGVPAAWKANGTDARADDLLNSLRFAPEQDYDGIGIARAFTLAVGRKANSK